ncbi:Hypothetical predicted protein [Paramuricea clavata]|uniref:Uncharacterized protein n=1 Tax=Paramuricea clavata TaxID=317549 RepID=A0A6S7J9N5_PARCT|nr:Hypothetical predicted protein [Paramuricea clavata]
MLHKAREEYYSTIIRDNAHDQKVLFQTVEKLLQKSSVRRYPLANSGRKFADAFADSFLAKIYGVRQDVLARKACLGSSLMNLTKLLVLGILAPSICKLKMS